MDAPSEPLARSIRRVFEESPRYGFVRVLVMPCVAAGWLSYYVIVQSAVDDAPTRVLLVCAVATAAFWCGLAGILVRMPRRLPRHVAHFVGVVTLGAAVGSFVGVTAGVVVRTFSP